MAWQHKKQIYESSWDISKDFDSVGRPLIRLAWERVVVPDEIIDWLIELDKDNLTVVWSTWAVQVWEAEGYEGFANDDDSKACYFDPERGTGQGDMSSPQTWIVFFDVILRALEQVDTDPFLLIDDKGGTRPAPDVSYADDLVSVAATRRGLQAKADIVSACAIILGLKIARHKLRAFSQDWTQPLQQSKAPQRSLVIYSHGWKPALVQIKKGGAIKCLGVYYDVNLSGTTQREESL